MKEQNLPRGGAAEGSGVGLTEEQVLASRRLHGANTLTKRKRKGFFRQYLSSFGDPIIKILMVALAINVIFLFRNSDWMESAGIAVAVFLATFVSTLSQYGSESAFIELQRASANIECRVRRAGGIRSLPVGELVVGDLVLLEAGEKLPADGVLLSGRLSVDQSALNGESAETEKMPLSAGNKEWDLMRKNQLFRGSIVSAGEGVMRVERVGDKTFYPRLHRCRRRKRQMETIELSGRTGQEVYEELKHRLEGMGYLPTADIKRREQGNMKIMLEILLFPSYFGGESAIKH